jgi:hypothetical protein
VSPPPAAPATSSNGPSLAEARERPGLSRRTHGITRTVAGAAAGLAAPRGFEGRTRYSKVAHVRQAGHAALSRSAFSAFWRLIFAVVFAFRRSLSPFERAICSRPSWVDHSALSVSASGSSCSPRLALMASR